MSGFMPERVARVVARFGDTEVARAPVNSQAFDAADPCRIRAPDSAALQTGEEFTLESWVRPEGELTDLPIQGSPAYELAITTRHGEGRIGTVDGSGYGIESPGAMQADIWQHLAMSFDGSRLRSTSKANWWQPGPSPGRTPASPAELSRSAAVAATISRAGSTDISSPIRVNRKTGNALFTNPKAGTSGRTVAAHRITAGSTTRGITVSPVWYRSPRLSRIAETKED